MNRQAALQDKIEAVQCVGTRSADRNRDGCDEPAAGRRRRHQAFRRRKAPRGAVQDLLEKPDLLLLDEPTNHLDAESVAWLERHLADYPGTIVAVTHDRYFLDNVAGWILEIEYGKGIPFEGNYTVVAGAKSEAAEDRREARVGPPAHAWRKELEWIRMAPKARQAKSKARISAYEKMVAEAVSREAR